MVAYMLEWEVAQGVNIKAGCRLKLEDSLHRVRRMGRGHHPDLWWGRRVELQGGRTLAVFVDKDAWPVRGRVLEHPKSTEGEGCPCAALYMQSMVRRSGGPVGYLDQGMLQHPEVMVMGSGRVGGPVGLLDQGKLSMVMEARGTGYRLHRTSARDQESKGVYTFMEAGGMVLDDWGNAAGPIVQGGGQELPKFRSYCAFVPVGWHIGT
eukprot:scaffold289436_cov21-Tisochrysis_lutea.AAC.2